MTDAELTRLADLVAERVAARLAVRDAATVPASAADDRQLVDAATLARILGVTRAYVYEHADDLGAVRLGDGPRARLRFDPDRARQVVKGSPASAPAAPTSPRKSRRGKPAPGSILTCRPMRKLETDDRGA